ncbi:MAG: putative ABC transporter permease subunit [Thermodesulfobacteriota bacterium]
MRDLALLLSPRVKGALNGIRLSESRARKRTWILGLLGIAFWFALFLLSARVLRYFQSVELVGDILAYHLLSMVLLTFFSLLVFSHVITSLSNLYLSKDLELCHATPASLEELFLSRVFYTIVDSSWMVIVFGLPVMMAYAYVYAPGPGFYFTLAHTGLATVLIAGGIGVLLTMILVNIFPAHRTRDILMLLVILLVVGLYMLFRFLRPERLVDPDAFFSAVQYMGALKAPDSPYLPTRWVAEVLWHHLGGGPAVGYGFHLALLWSTAAALLVIDVWAAGGIYFNGFSRAREGKRRRPGGGLFLNLLGRLFARPLGPDLRAVVDKDIRTFFRDNSQWSQLILLGALVVVYLYNFSVLPLERSPIRLEFLQNQIAFLNLGLAGFVLSAISVRFIFPAVSAEGRAFWIIRSSPLTIRRFLWGKFIVYLIPMLVLGEILIVFTNRLLQVTPFMMGLLAVSMFFSVFGIVAMGVALGAMYPKFRYENIAQVSTGFGGVVYMMISSLFMAVVILLEAAPVYVIFTAGVRGVAVTTLQYMWIVPVFFLVLVFQAAAVIVPMRLGIRALGEGE